MTKAIFSSMFMAKTAADRFLNASVACSIAEGLRLGGGVSEIRCDGGGSLKNEISSSQYACGEYVIAAESSSSSEEGEESSLSLTLLPE